MHVLALYDIHAAPGRRMLASGWPGERSIAAALTKPVAALEMTRCFEARATSSSGS